MVRHFKYCLLILLVAATGCRRSKVDEATKWQITLREDDKGPYGAYLAHQSLKYYFPEAQIETLPSKFRYTSMSDDMKYNLSGHTLMILEGLAFHLSPLEWTGLKQFIKNGNEVVVFCSTLDDKIEKELNCYKHIDVEEQYLYYQSASDFDNKDMLSLADYPHKKYGYEGRSLRGYFIPKNEKEPVDTTQDNQPQNDTDEKWAVPDTLGYVHSTPDFVRYNIGEGHLTLHAAPLALSNYFLLQRGNENYLTGIWKTFPDGINKIYWQGYYYRSTDLSSFDILWRYPATRMALTLGILLLIIYVIFEAKRKQRIIPVIPPLRNDSVSFVETVGRLYYNKGNHTNLAEKMIQQFLEWVRTHYFLNTNQLDEHFAQLLVIKSGQPEAAVRNLLEMVKEIKTGYAYTDDAYLYQLYNTIQQFYKNNHT